MKDRIEQETYGIHHVGIRAFRCRHFFVAKRESIRSLPLNSVYCPEDEVNGRVGSLALTNAMQ